MTTTAGLKKCLCNRSVQGCPLPCLVHDSSLEFDEKYKIMYGIPDPTKTCPDCLKGQACTEHDTPPGFMTKWTRALKSRTCSDQCNHDNPNESRKPRFCFVHSSEKEIMKRYYKIPWPAIPKVQCACGRKYKGVPLPCFAHDSVPECTEKLKIMNAIPLDIKI